MQLENENIFRVRSPGHKTGEMEEKSGCQDISGKKLSSQTGTIEDWVVTWACDTEFCKEEDFLVCVCVCVCV